MSCTNQENKCLAQSHTVFFLKIGFTGKWLKNLSTQNEFSEKWQISFLGQFLDIWGLSCSKGFISKAFQELHFLFSWETGFWVICRWNKFEEKAQCVTVPNGPKPKIRFLNFLLDLSLSTYSRVLSSRVSRLANLHSQTKML